MLDPFNNPQLRPALNQETKEAFWLGHVGQGCEDVQVMSDAHRKEFFDLMDSDSLKAAETRYVYAVGQRLTIYLPLASIDEQEPSHNQH